MTWPTSQKRLIAKTKDPMAMPPKAPTKPQAQRKASPQAYAQALGKMR